ncbi:MAG: hypothetical protein A2Z01_01050 [Betaproteobacteria bacterium RBG_16_58_11]|nr:MAG: hypothetical protein A2Z01_01050 [Betaproteobacteria bacterium RBG_16_58_11]OFZ96603.1 MAG: hypothetical protein A2Z44_06830 [Betaproteobacteria bacterium RBG_19FT_COMBO_58_11]
MRTRHAPAAIFTSHEERAFFARLAALNVAFESARAGKPAQSFGHRAQSSEALLTAFLSEIQTHRSE